MLAKSIVALITPFDESGKVDFLALEALIKWHIEEGTDGLVLCGSTGEGSSLSVEEKRAIFSRAVAIAKGKMTLIAGSGSHQTQESVDLTRQAKKIGMDAALVVVPYYFLPTEEGCFLHFSEIANVGLPMILYHHPGRTGIKLSIHTIGRICAIPEIIAIKDASEDIHLVTEVLKQTKTPLFSGIDTLCLPFFSLGFSGSISIIGNVVPRSWKQFIETALRGELLEARKQFFSLYELCQAMVLETNPQCVKYAVSLLGKCSSKMRLPLVEPRKENQEKIQLAMRSALGQLLRMV